MKTEIWKLITKKKSAIAFLFLTSFLFLLISGGSAAKAANGADFQAGRIIDDVVFTNNQAMSVQQIQAFLDAKVPVCDRWRPSSNPNYQPPWTCLKEYQENPLTGENNLGRMGSDGNPIAIPGGKTAAQLIWEAAQTHRINPQVILVTLQKEQSLVTDDWPWAIQYWRAMGNRCPDGPGGAQCDPAYAGFANQVDGGAWQFRHDFNGIGTPGFWAPYYQGWNNILYQDPNTNPNCGTRRVFIENQATAVLYKYTPYTPNQAALDNLYGTGDSCSSYGNRNFWRLFTDWFGDSIRNLVTANGGVYLIQNGQKRAFPSEEVFLSNGYRWSEVLSVSPTELALLPDGPAMTYNINYRLGRLVRPNVGGGGIYLIQDGYKRAIPNTETFNSYSYPWSEVIAISPVELGLIPDGLVLSYNVNFRNGKLVSTPGQGAYLVENGMKRPFPSAEVFVSYSYRWSDIITTSPTEMELIPNGTAMAYNTNFRNGKLITTSGQGAYLVENGMKRPFPSAEVFVSYSYRWSDIITTSPTEMELIPNGTAMAYNTNFRNGKLVAAPGQGVYLVENGSKRPFPSAEVFIGLSYKWSDIISVNAAEILIIPDGPVMSV